MCIGTATAGAAVGSALAMGVPLAIPRPAAAAAVRYVGAQRVAGPAPRGLPFIPIRLTPEGAFEGRPVVKDLDDSEINVLDWYKYCGHSGAPGLVPDADKANTLIYSISEEKAKAIKPWYVDRLDAPVRPDDFPDNEFGAGFAWRSGGERGANVLSGVVIRFKRKAIRKPPQIYNPAKPLSDEEHAWVKREFFVDVGESTFAACSTFCTHFCCIPGYKEAERLARPRNAWDKIFCTCHNSVYDMREPVRYTMFPEPAKEGPETSGGGGH